MRGSTRGGGSTGHGDYRSGEVGRLRTGLMSIVALLAMFVGISPEGSAYVPHAPIVIDGDADFTSANGVVRGRGTLSDPFIIEGWEINASATVGIWVRNTRAHFVLRGNFVHSGGQRFTGMMLVNVENAFVERNTATSSEFGLRFDVSTNVVVFDNDFSSNGGGGIYVGASRDATLSANRIDSNRWSGILLSSSSMITIVQNQIARNQVGIGLAGSTNVTIASNAFSLDGVYIDGNDVSHFDSHAISTNNLVNGRPLRYYRACSDLIVDSLETGQLIVANCERVRVANLDITETDIGIEMAFVRSVVVAANRLARNDIAVWGMAMRDAIFSANEVTNGTYGFVLRGLTNATITDNEASSHLEFGIFVDGSDGVIIRGNRASSNVRTGLVLGGMSNVTVATNTLVGNGEDGVYQSGSSNLTFIGNNASSNGRLGMAIGGTNLRVVSNRASMNGQDGIRVINGDRVLIHTNNVSNNGYGIRLWNSIGVTTHGNRLDVNGVQGEDSRGPENVWDAGYPAGGNYWSDYGGTDNCSGPNQNVCPDPDGIGDTPYGIDADSVDRYPLMRSPILNAPPSVKLLVPNGSVDWTGGSGHDVSWSMGDAEDSVLAVSLELSADGGLTFPHLIFSGSRPSGTGFISWTLPLINTTQSRIRVCVTDSQAQTACDVSEADFTIDSERPTLTESDPADRARDVPVDAEIVLTFSEPMSRAETQAAITISPSPGPLTFHWSDDSMVLIVQPAFLNTSTTYAVSIGSGAQDASEPGNSMVSPFPTFHLTTAHPAPPSPHAVAIGPREARVGTAVTFDGRDSTGSLEQWLWTITNADGETVAALEGPLVTYTFRDSGRHRVTLVVRDAIQQVDQVAFEIEVVASPSNAAGMEFPWILATLALVAFAAFAASEPGRVAVLGATVAPLFGRRPKGEKDSETRGAILGYLRVHPGDTYTDLKRNLGLNDGVVTWHLGRLEKDRLVRSAIRGARKRYYPIDVAAPVEDGGELHEIQRRLREVVEHEPGMSVQVLAETLGVSSQLALYHLRKMASREIVSLERRGVRLRAFPGTAAEARPGRLGSPRGER